MRVIELFAGIGAQTTALKNIGVNHTVVGISEIDDSAIRAYTAIHGPVNNFGDISKIDMLPAADLWTYSFPCQDLSNAGKKRGCKRGGGTRSGLLWEVERLLNASKSSNTLPKYLLLENVSDLCNTRNKADFYQWLSFLHSIGYENYYKILNARNYGIPQNRARCFVVSVLGGVGYAFPRPIKLTRRASDYLDMQSNHKKLNHTTAAFNLVLDINSTTAKIQNGTKQGYIICNNYGFCELDFPKCQTRRGRVIDGGRICSAIVTKPSGIYVFMDGDFYNISSRECWRLMGFSDADYDVAATVCNDAELYKLAGNSICVPVLEQVFYKMFVDREINGHQYNIDEIMRLMGVNA